MAFQIKQWISGRHAAWERLIHQGIASLLRLGVQSESSDYRAWRYRFMLDRLHLCLWIACFCFITFVVQDIYSLFLYPASFNESVLRRFGDAAVADQLRSRAIATNIITGSLLSVCLGIYRTAVGRRYPLILFLCFSLFITLVPQIVGTFFNLPDTRVTLWILVFLAQATLIPVFWPLHLVSQIGAIGYYAVVNPILGLTEIQGQSIYTPGRFVYLFWACLICDLAVHLYERLKRSEFEAQRQLKVFLHSISHDLQTPVVGASMLLKSLLNSADEKITVHRSVLERLLEGSDRQSTLINSLLEAHSSELPLNSFHPEPVQLSTIVESVLANLEPLLEKNQVQLFNWVHADLPLVHVDGNQIWRVYCNLISNALKHNPNQICLTLEAELVEASAVQRTAKPGERGTTHYPFSPLSANRQRSRTQKVLRCSVQDNGVGLAPDQCRRLFALYARGARARYMPGLGLGLYLCRQIIEAHGGQIGVNSQLGQGSTFWFTLPLAPSQNGALL
ncbi:HAMP domain-containing histidine kinase [Oculatella sp. LEGE 06141]|uniref:sensor histidine kinase n=1 Tax=Oculatella sp. LEGE 06141 TaxID=1828648 RepID=UPI00187EE10D|nr:HAMP domain-containing sensor histidine kinase [Oculatella sp. LEGE 06141]MBE9179643.1 HAMP domain-containing histidine kinase [Oculatella sp. LEGE 06141]